MLNAKTTTTALLQILYYLLLQLFKLLIHNGKKSLFSNRSCILPTKVTWHEPKDQKTATRREKWWYDQCLKIQNDWLNGLRGQGGKLQTWGMWRMTCPGWARIHRGTRLTKAVLFGRTAAILMTVYYDHLSERRQKKMERRKAFPNRPLRRLPARRGKECWCFPVCCTSDWWRRTTEIS